MKKLHGNKGKKRPGIGGVKKGSIPWNKGIAFSKEIRHKFHLSHIGKKPSLETRKRMSESHKGDKHPNWKGGLSLNLYPTEFNKELKLKIRTRDNFTCCLCGITEREHLEELNRVLCVNHIDFNKSNCIESNLNTLCLRCNIKINREREYWTEYFNNINN